MFGPGFYRLDFPSDISLGVFRLARLASSEDNTIRMFGLTDSHISQQSQLRLVVAEAEGENWSSSGGAECK